MDTPQVNREILDNIQQHGWHVMLLQGDATGPAIAYSIGLYQHFGHAELVMTGLQLPVMHSLVNHLGEQVRQGRRYQAGERDQGLLKQGYCRFERVGIQHYYRHLGFARWFYRDQDDFPALQCLWPDAQGHFPDQAHFDPAYAERQWLLTDETPIDASVE